MTLIDIIGITAALLTSTGFVPQLYKGIKRRSLRDVSYIFLVETSAGVALWGIYGIARHDRIIMIANGFTLVTVLTILGCKIYFRRFYTGGSK